MRKAILISSILVVLCIGMNSCKKCYVCTRTTTEVLFGQDTTLVLTTEECSGKNGAGANLNVTIQDIESTGYICTPK
jgi:hypothetical protein